MFNPRLTQILLILLQQEAVSPDFLAEQCKISKRTIYRELSDIDNSLKQYGLVLHSRVKKGIKLSGDDEGKRRLREDLEKNKRFNPRDRDERQSILIKELLKQDEPRKIYYFSELLQVSETTVSNDLEALEDWFQSVKIQLVRKSGVGILLQYEELDYRKALYHVIMDHLGEIPIFQLRNGIDQNYQKLQELKELFDWKMAESIQKIVEAPPVPEEITRMTESSLLGFICYIAISISRIKQRKPLYIPYKELEQRKKDLHYGFVKALIKQLETFFQCSISQDEIVNIYHHYCGSKLQAVDDSSLQKEAAKAEVTALKTMVFKMCDVFDPKIAFELKQDEELIHGLVAHLQPTFTRLRYKFAISNPLLEDIKAIYPEIFEKSKAAAGVLENKFGYPIPEDEVGFLALHFGGAMVRIKHHRQSFYRKIQVGVTCASGIGISSLLSSRLRQLYGDKVQIKIFSKQDLESAVHPEVDLLVTTFEIPGIEIPVVKVHPILTEENVRTLSERLEGIAGRQEGLIQAADLWEEEFDETVMIVNEMNHIISRFAVYQVDHKLSFDQIVRYISQVMAVKESQKKEIYDAIWERERLSTQVLPEFEIALLHAKTAVVEYSQMIVLKPDQDHFLKEPMQRIKTVLAVLIPAIDKRRIPVVSSICSCLFDEERFLELMKNGSKEEMLSGIKRVLNRFFEEHMHRRYC